MFERIVVLGSSGSGKTTFAKQLAHAGWAHLELDSLWQRGKPAP
ncbi:MAG: hypothetical protein AAGE52_21610 [Myxococcota bacterium]